MYVLAVKLTAKNSYNIRSILSKNGFAIFAFNGITGELTLDHTNYNENELLFFNTKEHMLYHCVYNGEALPPNLIDIIKELEENQDAVLAYCIEKK